MKKSFKITALILMLVMTLGAFSGCLVTSDGSSGNEGTVYAELTVGLPYTSDDALWTDLVEMITGQYGFNFMNDAIVTVVNVPEEGSENYEEFLKKVSNGKIDMFLAPSSEGINELIDNGYLSSATKIGKQDSSFTSGLIDTYSALSREDNRLGYSIPFYGTYQGIFINTDVFERANVELPTDWASLMTAIDQLNAAGVTPFAAGFTDGAGYWLDEMIFVEGGVAEHSATPSKGTINSWTRAVKNIKDLYNKSAFSSSALTDTHDAAIAHFINQDAAMILCSSGDLAGRVSTETVGYMNFPVSDTGIKEENSYIGESELGFYIYSKSLSKQVDEITSLSGIMKEFITMMAEEHYVDVFAAEGTFPFNPAGDGSMDAAYEEAAWNVISEAKSADVPMSNYILTFDQMASGLVDVLDGSVSVDDYLADATATEITAQAEKKAAEKEAEE